ncbi:DUF1080 domain-containing protein [Aggregatimonas sangjinii]|uniref:DUF1080 domain-containing protein n=1 Tax=Aggregatimonas sangjinii TaxID=2583587 RepID=A0A5B7SSW1_9FLAO|nr:DUF1080 domain-containing protein [Aggregatimonas sangjinii]QCX01617.1 DUF1080 domain-containing protein [Aggregatimonas sangjinii]
MKNLFTLFLILLVFGCKEKPTETSEEKDAEMIAKTELATQENEWTVLFDGTSFDGWHEYLKAEVSENWKIEDGAMVFHPPENREDKESFNLVSDKTYTDFILSLEWRISEGGNSGVFWGIKEIESLKKPYETGPEIQVLDNDRHPDGKNGKSHQAGALYDMVSPTEDVTKPVGEWNLFEITINHQTNSGGVVLNGTEIVKFPLNDPEWKEMVSKSKFADWEHFGKYTTGKIGLQDHGDRVAFRNIKIKEL